MDRVQAGDYNCLAEAIIVQEYYNGIGDDERRANVRGAGRTTSAARLAAAEKATGKTASDLRNSPENSGKGWTCVPCAPWTLTVEAGGVVRSKGLHERFAPLKRAKRSETAFGPPLGSKAKKKPKYTQDDEDVAKTMAELSTPRRGSSSASGGGGAAAAPGAAREVVLVTSCPTRILTSGEKFPPASNWKRKRRPEGTTGPPYEKFFCCPGGCCKKVWWMPKEHSQMAMCMCRSCRKVNASFQVPHNIVPRLKWKTPSSESEVSSFPDHWAFEVAIPVPRLPREGAEGAERSMHSLMMEQMLHLRF